jgi:DNA-binding LacI/PurR family transcriptional regulator
METAVEILGYKPKYALIADIVRKQIMLGKFKNGDRLLPDDELAKKYFVNKRTIAAGLNSLVEEGLLERAPRRGTIVIKETVKGKSVTNAVAMVMLSKGDVYSNISLEISKGLELRKLYPVLINEHVINNAHSVKNYLDGMVDEEHRPYGFVIDGHLNFPFDYLKSNLQRFENIVFITKYHHPEKIASAKYALVDLAEAGRLAARHFIRLGHKKMTCLAMPELNYLGEWASMQVQIMTGFAQECRENNIKFSDEIFWSLLHGAPFESTVSALLKKKDRPSAIFAYNDSFIRFNLIPLFESNGLNPMKDVELVGFYNTHHSTECGFSSICIREDKIAEAAVKLLTGETEKKEILVKPELIVRGQ